MAVHGADSKLALLSYANLFIFPYPIEGVANSSDGQHLVCFMVPIKC